MIAGHVLHHVRCADSLVRTLQRRFAQLYASSPPGAPMQQFISLSTSKPGPRVRASAIGLGLILCLTFLITLPFVNVQLPRLNPFIPMVVAVIVVLDLLTAAVFFDEIFDNPRSSTVVLAAAYLFSGFIAVPYALAFPQAFSDEYLIGGVQSATWLYLIWHTIFPICILGYVFLRAKEIALGYKPEQLVPTVIIICLGVVLASTLLAQNSDWLLPPIRAGEIAGGRLVRIAAIACAVPAAFALLALWSYRKTTLDAWLMVVMLAAVFEPILLGFPSSRFKLGFYVSRFFGIVSSSTLLLVMLMETRSVYHRLLTLTARLQHEQDNRLTTLEAAIGAVRHELRQPIAAIRLNAEAGVLFLKDEKPEVGECLVQIIGDTARLNSIITNIGGALGTSAVKPQKVDVNSIIRRAIEIQQRDLDTNGVVASTHLVEDLPSASCEAGHLLEVLINLMQNAIDALRKVPQGRRFLKIAARAGATDEVVLTVEDTAGGIDSLNLARVFQPFVSTKPGGMGLGLPICRSIVERYSGKMSVSNGSSGAVFQVSLPVWLAAEGTSAP
jgi:signal transduction histidine kinase